MLERPGIEGEFEGAREVGGGAAVGPAKETIALEAVDVAADRHFRDPQRARQLADLDGLLVRNPFQDLVTAVNRQHLPHNLLQSPAHLPVRRQRTR